MCGSHLVEGTYPHDIERVWYKSGIYSNISLPVLNPLPPQLAYKLVDNLPIQTYMLSSHSISNTSTSLVLVLVSDLPHLTKLMPSSAERILELQDLDLKRKNKHGQ
jgi:hypothetical protein